MPSASIMRLIEARASTGRHRTNSTADQLEMSAAILVVGLPVAYAPMFAPPYPEPKLLVGVAALVLAARSGIQVARSLAAAASAVAIAGAAATLASPNWYTSLMGLPHQSAGLVLLGLSVGALLVGGAAAPGLAAKAALWIANTAAALAALRVVAVVPGAGDVLDRYGLEAAATFGQPVHFAGFMALGLVALAAGRDRPRWGLVVRVALVASGLSLAANRSGAVAAVLGLALLSAKQRRVTRPVAVVIVVSALAFASWAAVDLAVERPRAEVSPVRRIDEFGARSTVNERVTHWDAAIRAWSRRPVLGWGPAGTWGPVLAEADPARQHSRGYQDPHNIVVGALASMGLAGFAALAALAALAFRGILRASREMSWVIGGVGTLLLHHLLQPLSVALTPILFLLVGIVLSQTTSRTTRLPRRALTTAAVAALLLVSVRAAATSFEWYGRLLGSVPAVRTAHRLEPLRYSSSYHLMRMLSFDAYLGDEAARREALRLADRDVELHAWHPDVRLFSANTHYLLGDKDRAWLLLVEHLRRFPNDYIGLAGAARLAEERGDHTTATAYLQRSARL